MDTSAGNAAPTVVKLNSPADILGVLPHRVGFHPTESLVVVCLHGPRLRDRLVMRLDLPEPHHDHRLAEEVESRLTERGADGAVLVVYTECAAPASGLAREPMLRALRRRLRAVGIEVVDALLVREGRWWSYICRDQSCCPAEGTPIPAAPTAAASLYAAEAVSRGAVVLPDRAALERSVEVRASDAVMVEALDEALWDLVDLLTDKNVEAVRREVLGTVDRLIARWSEGDTTIGPREAAVVVLGLRYKTLRDRVMTLVLDHDAHLLSALFTELAGRTPDEIAAPVCSVLAWTAYAAGSGALAGVAAERALRVEPGYEVAELIMAGLQSMQPPDTIHKVSALVRADLELTAVEQATDLELDLGRDLDDEAEGCCACDETEGCCAADDWAWDEGCSGPACPDCARWGGDEAS